MFHRVACSFIIQVCSWVGFGALRGESLISLGKVVRIMLHSSSNYDANSVARVSKTYTPLPGHATSGDVDSVPPSKAFITMMPRIVSMRCKCNRKTATMRHEVHS